MVPFVLCLLAAEGHMYLLFLNKNGEYFVSLFFIIPALLQIIRLSPSRSGQNASARFAYMAWLVTQYIHTPCHGHTAVPCIGPK